MRYKKPYINESDNKDNKKFSSSEKAGLAT